MKISVILLILVPLLLACKPVKARRPVIQKTSITMQATIAQSKKLNALEDSRIRRWIAKDTLHTYKTSPKGFWYCYLNKKEGNLPTAKKGDIAVIQYEISTLDNTIIYSKQALGTKNYHIDKEDFIPALQDGIKLMKAGETITFIIPPYRGFGITGDGNKIGMNETLKSTVTLIKIIN